MIYTLIIAALLLFASQRWPNFSAVFRVSAFVICAVGLIILTKVGYTLELLQAMVMAPKHYYDTDILRVVTSNGAGVWREYNGLTTVRDTLANVPSHIDGAQFYATDINAVLLSDGTIWRCIYKVPVFVSATSGGTTTVSARGGLVVNTGGSIASHTVTLPSGTNAVSGDRVTFSTAGAITALTVNAGAATVSGAPTTLAANSSFEFVYNTSSTTWYRVR